MPISEYNYSLVDILKKNLSIIMCLKFLKWTVPKTWLMIAEMNRLSGIVLFMCISDCTMTLVTPKCLDHMGNMSQVCQILTFCFKLIPKNVKYKISKSVSAKEYNC